MRVPPARMVVHEPDGAAGRRGEEAFGDLAVLRPAGREPRPPRLHVTTGAVAGLAHGVGRALYGVGDYGGFAGDPRIIGLRFGWTLP